MTQLEELKQEIEIIKNNIKRVEIFIGELKHRLTALKGTITVVTKMSTGDLF